MCGPSVKRIPRCYVNWVRERVEHGYLQLAKVAPADNVTDIITKLITGGSYTTKAASTALRTRL
jgi:hypothetical protein